MQRRRVSYRSISSVLVPLAIVMFGLSAAAQVTTVSPAQPGLELSLLVNAGEEEQKVQITDPAELSEIQGMLLGIQPAQQPGWPDLGFRGMQLVNRGVSGFPDAVRVFEGVIQVSQNTSETFYLDERGLEAKLTSKITPVLVVLAKQALKSSSALLPANSELLLVLDPPVREPVKDPNPTNGSEPQYEPNKWNVVNVRVNNNCYTYATNLTNFPGRTRPGRGGGKEPPAPGAPQGYNKANFKAALLSDGLTEIDCSKPCPANSYKIAFVLKLMGPGPQDFHVYRQDAGGKWSHKPGMTAATDKDNSGNPITDIEKADFGDYKEFVGCFCVDPKKVTVR